MTSPWVDPLQAARWCNSRYDDWVFLHSSMRAGHSGRYSILAFDVEEEAKGDSFDALVDRLPLTDDGKENPLTTNRQPSTNHWFGYLGYPLRHDLENLPRDAPGAFDLPALWLRRFRRVWVFDLDERTVTENGEALRPGSPALQDSGFGIQDSAGFPEVVASVASLSSNMTTREYLEKVATVKEAIARGDLSQANLTRKFFGEFRESADSFALFVRLCEVSPAPYSAYLRYGDTRILSSSPEQFLHISADGRIETRPIKGSASAEAGGRALHASEKDRAENLMIVDLMRNDLSRVCEVGSIAVPNLYEITRYATIRHMSTTITGRLRRNKTALDAVMACFPPGSMTGTPKIKAMELCSQLERTERGVYSGAIGYFGADGSADFSVVIRTLITDGNRFEFQVGGAIVADSDPHNELEETLLKAKGLCESLAIDSQLLLTC